MDAKVRHNRDKRRRFRRLTGQEAAISSKIASIGPLWGPFWTFSREPGIFPTTEKRFWSRRRCIPPDDTAFLSRSNCLADRQRCRYYPLMPVVVLFTAAVSNLLTHGYADVSLRSGSPATHRLRFPANDLATRRPCPSEAAALCEVMMTLGKSQNSESAGSGSTSKTSR
jgi:hypothetical protein